MNPEDACCKTRLVFCVQKYFIVMQSVFYPDDRITER